MELSEAARAARNAYQRKYYAEHIEQMRAYQKRYRETHREVFKASAQRYWERKGEELAKEPRQEPRQESIRTFKQMQEDLKNAKPDPPPRTFK